MGHPMKTSLTTWGHKGSKDRLSLSRATEEMPSDGQSYEGQQYGAYKQALPSSEHHYGGYEQTSPSEGQYHGAIAAPPTRVIEPETRLLFNQQEYQKCHSI